MHARLASLAVAAALATGTTATSQDRIDLDLLYVGNADTPRAAAYEALLARHFRSVRVEAREGFDPGTVGDADVVLLDWAQRDVPRGMRLDLESPLGPREDWTTPTVLIGSAGLLIAGPWQTPGAYG